MSLNLDSRRIAMLREMGIRVWQPDAPAAETPIAIKSIAIGADAASAIADFSSNSQAIAPAAAPRSAQPSRQPAVRQAAAAAHATPAGASADSAQAGWLLGRAQPLFADTAQPGGPRWLVLAETSAAALSAPILEGETGKLLANMLRAAGLDRAGAALLAPLARQDSALATAERQVPAALPALLAEARPDVVLVMGRLAALALLASDEPFGKLRGKVHALRGVNAVVTYNPGHLLRKCEDKAGAWSDLCLAMSLAPPAP